MSTTTNQVIVGFDFSHSGREALLRALALATRAPFHVLHFICVLDPHQPIPALPAERVDYQYAEYVQQSLSKYIADALELAEVIDRVHFFVHVRIGKPAEEILNLAREVGAELILVGSKGLTGLERLVLGSVAEKVVREAQCTVEVVRARTYPYVQLLDVIEKPAQDGYVAPHRYTYENKNLMQRPTAWPLY